MRTHTWLWLTTAAMLAAPGSGLAAQASEPIRICLAPAQVEASTNAAAAIDAVRETFSSYLSGPSISTQPLTARLASLAREEAKQAGCPYLLVTTVKLVNKRSGGGLLGQIAAGAARQGALEAGVTSGSTVGRIAGSAAHVGLSQASLNYAITVRNKDELTLGYRLEAADGKVLLDQREKRNAKSDGEDVLTPVIQIAAEAIVTATKK